MSSREPTRTKKYTTLYNDFMGVDFSNDPSNVFRRRSPGGKNMLPDLSGKPFKRKGWDIELTPADFRSAAGISDSSIRVIPDRMYYFELGGYDYLMIFNNLGIFSYSANPLSDSPYKRLLVCHKTYLDKSNQTQNMPANIDPRKAFFFEGGGTAGFYVFAGVNMFMYDGAVFHEVSPYVPYVLMLCDPTGAGTDLEPINMLTPKRTVGFACVHTSTTTYDDQGDPVTTVTAPDTFYLPGGYASVLTVETRNESTGAWEAASNYTLSNNEKIVFSTGHEPPEVMPGEDNLRVTYLPTGSAITFGTETISLKEREISITKTTLQERHTSIHNNTYSAWRDVSETYSFNGTKFDASGITTNASTKEKDFSLYIRNSANNAWVALSGTYAESAFLGYENSLSVKPKEELFTGSFYAETQANTSNPVTFKQYVGQKRHVFRQTRTVTETKTYRVKSTFTAYKYITGSSTNEAVTAFSQCARASVFGSGIINQVFLSASQREDYNTRVWYCRATDPTYWPDTNYIEVGATDMPIMGMMKLGEYLGIIKKGNTSDTSIYLAYPTSFDDDTTFAVKQNISGIGAIATGAFNILNEEPLFLSKNGIMGIEVSNSDTDRQLRNRSFYINKKLCDEPNIDTAISFVYDGLYYLAVDGNCYVLDGSQKSSWQNSKTNLQYECYYLENVPAQCFAKFNDELWFTDFKGNLCRFRSETEEHPYRDAYSLGKADWYTVALPINNKVYVQNLSAVDGTLRTPKVGEVVLWRTTDLWYTITALDQTYAYLTPGVPIDAVWSTIADDDGAEQFFKNLQKKGCLVSLLPASDSGVKVYLKPDEKDPILVGETDAKGYILPSDYYMKKKVKKYKRLQIICENDVIDDSFGIDQIIKTYTYGNYSKNKG